MSQNTEGGGPPHSPGASWISTFFVSNVHCSSCVAYITTALSAIHGTGDINVSILTHEVRVAHIPAIDPILIAKTLIQAAFEVHHVVTRDSTGVVVSELDTVSLLPRDAAIFAPLPDSSVALQGIKHLENCEACRKEELERSALKTSTDLGDGALQDSKSTKTLVRVSSSLLPKPSQTEPKPGMFTARISIEGMSCASCVDSITNEIKTLDFVEEITVNLLANNAMVVYQGPRSNIEKVTEHIEDIGFEACVGEVNTVNTNAPSTRSRDSYVAEIAIGGMTCGSCTGAISRGLDELPFVTDVSINLLSNSGKVEFEGRVHSSAILGKIEDLGYDAALISVYPKPVEDGHAVIEKRTVLFRVEGMFCHHCPEKVFSSLGELPGVEWDNSLSVKNPILKVTYTISPPSITVRSLLRKVESTHSEFQVTVYHPPSIEDRTQAMQIHERRRLLLRFLFVLIVAIPTFLIGIVFMSLVSADNQVRRYLEQSAWSGSVSRIEWSLLIMTTPVMFYGTDIFHVRAAKEIHSLWRIGSRVPLLQRFYRFGSMNLLISAGTMVAYISSLAVLIVDAVSEGHPGMHSSTYFDTVVFLTLFILAGRYIEAYSKARAGDAVAALGKLKPSEALLVAKELESTGDYGTITVSPDEIQRISVDLLEIGDLVRVPYGASPPADGKIVGAGTYQFDESSLTGESKPVSKSAGDQVYTGSLNVGQPVEFEISAVGASSMLDQIIAVVREGQSRRAPMERVAQVLVAHFVPAITLVAVLTFLIWLSLGYSGVLPIDYLDIERGGWAFWSLEFAIAVFVVACPCGLALAAPTALFVGGGLAARHGILVKGGGEAFQEASRLNAIVFDKTGTLTEGGSLKVSDHEILITDSNQLQVAWALARVLEENSNHPIARAVAEFCQEQPGASVISSEIEEKTGQGMRGTFTVLVEDDQQSTKNTCRYEAVIGNQGWIQSLAKPNFDTHYLSNALSKHQAAGKSTAILSIREIDAPDSAAPEPGFLPGIVFAISDSIRPDAAAVVSKLQQRKINVFMCTGDNLTTAHAVADMVGIPRANVMANVLPSGKADFVRAVQYGDLGRSSRSNLDGDIEAQAGKSRSIVAFVGDGVNDSPALAAADVSIAMASGSDVAMNSASFILLNSELDTILQLAVLSRRVINRIKMNFGWAVVYNVCLVPVAAGIFYPIVSGYRMKMVDGETVMLESHWRLSPVWAALAMALSSISVVCSSLALVIDKRFIKRLFGLSKQR